MFGEVWVPMDTIARENQYNGTLQRGDKSKDHNENDKQTRSASHVEEQNKIEKKTKKSKLKNCTII